MGKKLRRRYYAVKVGRKPGIYKTWEECKAQVDHFPGNVFKGFDKYEEARDFMKPKQPDLFQYEAKAYTDGSYDDESGHAGYACILLHKDSKYLIQGKIVDTDSRQIIGELFACRKAIQKAISLGIKSLQIYFDYIGVELWANGEWEAKKEVTKDYLSFINSVKDDIKLGFVKVKAHSGNPLNEEVDKYAKQAIDMEGTYLSIKLK